MPIDISKITIVEKIEIIGKEDISLLLDVCEAARIYLADHKGESYACSGLNINKRKDMETFLQRMFDGVFDNA